MAHPRQNLLIIDDDVSMREVLKEALVKKHFEVDAVVDGPSGLALAREKDFDLVLVDLCLPTMDGFEVCRSFKAETRLCQIPIVLITGRESVEDKIRGFELGAVDFLNKPFDLSELHARLAAILRRQRRQDKLLASSRREKQRTQQELVRISKAMDSTSDAISITDASGRVVYLNAAYRQWFGEEQSSTVGVPRPHPGVINSTDWQTIWQTCRTGHSWRGELNLPYRTGRSMPMLVRVNAIHDDEGRFLGTVWIYTDITERKRLEHDLAYLATHDSLTHLPNRRSFAEQLDRAVQLANQGTPCVLLNLDVDYFKIINDSLGHHTGDRVLVDLAALLRRHLRAGDFLGRVGGDEFAIILWHTTGEQAEKAADGIVRLFDDFRYLHKGRVFTTTVSIGIAVLNGNASAEEAQAQADRACYRAKTKGRNRWECTHANDSDLALARQEAMLAPQIKDALREGRFELWLQPIVPLQTDSLDTHLFEVLLRMRDAQNLLLLPPCFIPIAERLGYMPQIDQWVLDHALALMNHHPSWKLSINLSAQSLADPDLLSYLTHLVDTHRIAPRRATLEITETAMIVNLADAASLLRELRRVGFNLALDDFGAGFSSLGYLRELPVDYLKIDRQFIQPLATDTFNQALVKSIGDLAHRLGRWTVAEGVETAQVLDVVRSLGMDFGQGWQLGPPQAMTAVGY